MGIVQAAWATVLALRLLPRNVLLCWDHCQNMQLDEFPSFIDRCAAILSLGMDFSLQCSIRTWKERAVLPVHTAQASSEARGNSRVTLWIFISMKKKPKLPFSFINMKRWHCQLSQAAHRLIFFTVSDRNRHFSVQLNCKMTQKSELRASFWNNRAKNGRWSLISHHTYRKMYIVRAIKTIKMFQKLTQQLILPARWNIWVIIYFLSKHRTLIFLYSFLLRTTEAFFFFFSPPQMSSWKKSLLPLYEKSQYY